MIRKNIVLIGMDGENSKRVFNTELENSDIIATITFDTFNRLNYLAIIPKSKIFTDKSLVRSRLWQMSRLDNR
jgi:hypothetical protein